MKSSIFLFPIFPKLVPNMDEKYLEISIYLLMYTGSVITWEVVYCWGKILFLVITFSIELSFCFLRASTAAYKYDSFKYSKWSVSHNSKFCYNQLKCSDSKCISSQLFMVRFEGTSVESLVIIVYKINLNHSNIVCDHSLSCVWFCSRMETDTVARQAPLSWDFPGKILEWVAIPFSRGFSSSRDQPTSPALSTTSRFFTTEPPGKTIFFNNLEYFP